MDINNCGLGCLESPIDERDYKLAEIYQKTELPKNFMLNYKFNILNQGSVGSCVAHALSECKSFIDDVDNMYSVGFIYANREKTQAQGSGMIPREALSNLVKYGDCYNSEFPINEEYPAIKTTLNKYGKEKLLKSASSHKSTAYISLETEEIKQYLYTQQKPIIIGVRVYSNFYNANNNKGLIPANPDGNYKGNHLMICIGYKGDTLVLVNSWSKNKGDNGLYYLDINSPIIRELWALEDKKMIRPVPAKPTPQNSGILYRLQLGAFKDYNNAVKYSNELNKKGIATCLKQYPDYWKIQVGCFKNKNNCIAYQKQLKSKGYNCFIVEEF